MYTFPTAVINSVTFTALRWGQFPTITYTVGATAGSEVVTVASDLSNITIQIADGVSTNLQIKTAVDASLTTVNSLKASDLVSVTIAGGHNSDTNTAVSATAMTGAVNVPAPKLSQTIAATVNIPSTQIDWSVAYIYRKTLSANTTFTFVNAVDGMQIRIALTNTASNYTVTWPAVRWTGGAAPTQTVGAKTDLYTFTKIGTVIYGTVVQDLS
jgi:hypothetical protein